MSNPGVILLASLKYNILQRISNKLLRRKHRIDIEDNLGESVHLHIDDLRLDCTVKEFINFSTEIESVFSQYIYSINPLLKFADYSFLGSISNHLHYLADVKIESVKISELSVIDYKDINFGIKKIVPINESKACLYLNNTSCEYLDYKQHGHVMQDNLDRITALNESVSKFGYPNNKYIVVFSDMVIRDGQHRASILYNNDPEQYVDVLRFYFHRGYKAHTIRYIFLRNLVGYFLKSSFSVVKFIKLTIKFFKENI